MFINKRNFYLESMSSCFDRFLYYLSVLRATDGEMTAIGRAVWHCQVPRAGARVVCEWVGGTQAAPG